MYQTPQRTFYIFTFDIGLINIVVEPEFLLTNSAGIGAVDEEIPDTKPANLVFLSGACHVISARVHFFRSSEPETPTGRKSLFTYYCPQDFEPEMIDEIVRWFESHQSETWKTFKDLSDSFRRFLEGEDDWEPPMVETEIIWEKFYFKTADLGEIAVVIGELATGDSLTEGLRFSLKNEEGNPEAGLQTYWGWHAFPSGNIEDAIAWLETYSSENQETFDDVIESFELFLEELHTPEMHPRAVEKPRTISIEINNPPQLFHSQRPPETTICFITGNVILLSNAECSSVSHRVAERSLLIPSERTPSRLGLPNEIRVCFISGKRLLSDEVVSSDFSKKLMDSFLAVSSTFSGRKCLPNELIICEESGIALLPDETEVCTITGKRVGKNLVSRSDLTERLGLSRLLLFCPESRKSAFPEELVLCEATGRHVNSDCLETCTASGKRILRRLMIQCAISNLWVDRELAVQSAKSWRWSKSEFKATCHWSGLTLLQDEVAFCKITGLSFDKQLVHRGMGATPLIELVRKGLPIHLDKSHQANHILAALAKAGIKARTINTQISPSGNCAAYYVDCSGLFGLRKRQAVGFISLGSEQELLGAPSIGLLLNHEWVPANQ
jgi:hypothetical protein